MFILRRIRADGTEVRIPFIVDDSKELQQTIIAEVKPSNYFDLLPIATSDLVKMSKVELILKVIGKCDHMTLNQSQLDHYAAIFKLTSKGPERESQIRMATRKGHGIKKSCGRLYAYTVLDRFMTFERGYKFIMQRIESPSTRLGWMAVARRELEPELGKCAECYEEEIHQLLALDKLLKIEQKLDSFGLYGGSVRNLTKNWMTQNITDITLPMIDELFDLVYLEFFVPPYDKRVTKARVLPL